MGAGIVDSTLFLVGGGGIGWESTGVKISVHHKNVLFLLNMLKSTIARFECFPHSR